MSFILDIAERAQLPPISIGRGAYSTVIVIDIHPHNTGGLELGGRHADDGFNLKGGGGNPYHPVLE